MITGQCQPTATCFLSSNSGTDRLTPVSKKPESLVILSGFFYGVDWGIYQTHIYVNQTAVGTWHAMSLRLFSETYFEGTRTDFSHINDDSTKRSARKKLLLRIYRRIGKAHIFISVAGDVFLHFLAEPLNS